MLTKTTI